MLRMEIPESDNNSDDIICNTKFPSAEESCSEYSVLSGRTLVIYSYRAFSEGEDDLVLLITVN